jgi:hypothetical protein
MTASKFGRHPSAGSRMPTLGATWSGTSRRLRLFVGGEVALRRAAGGRPPHEQRTRYYAVAIDARQILDRSNRTSSTAIVSVGLHSVPGLLWGQRARHDVTVETLAGVRSQEGVLSRSPGARRSRRQTPAARCSALGLGDRNRIFIDVETDEKRSRL